MAPQGPQAVVNSDEMGTSSMSSFMAGGTIGIGCETEECDPISEMEFRVLMVFVASAALAFGCIVNGWLI